MRTTPNFKRSKHPKSMFRIFTSLCALASLIVICSPKLIGQSNCDSIMSNLQDPLVEPASPALLDLCCAFESNLPRVCYDLSGFTCSSTPLFSGITLPQGFVGAAVSFSGLDELAGEMNTICINNGVPIFFEADLSANTICALGLDSLTAYSFGDLQLNCRSRKDQFPPSVSGVPCPYEGLTIGDVLAGGDGIPDSLFAGSPSAVALSDLEALGGEPGSPIPSGTSISQMASFLALILESGSYLCEDNEMSNLNCMMNDFLGNDSMPLDSLFTMVTSPELGLEDVPENATFEDFEAEFLAGMNEIVNSPGGLAGLVNNLLGTGFSTEDCSEGFGLLPLTGDRKTHGQRSQSEAPSTAVDSDFFEDYLPGLGQEGAAISTPSPTALALISQIKSGVDLYNGNQSTSIPLYSINANDLSVPISLSNVGNGLKINDMGSLAGQGWKLNAGSMITRIVNGLPDEFDGVVHGAGVGKSNAMQLRVNYVSALGAQLSFPGVNSIPCISINQVHHGFVAGQEEGLPIGEGLSPLGGGNGELVPVELDISWSPLQPNRIRFIIAIPVFKFWGITVYVTLAADIALQLEQRLSSIVYEEDGLGYLYTDSGALMQSFGGLPSMPENGSFLEGMSTADKIKVLQSIHAGRNLDDLRFLNDYFTGFEVWMEAFLELLEDDYVPTYKSKKLDVEPDEFYFEAGGYSGTFVLSKDGQAAHITPYTPGLSVESIEISDGHLSSFKIRVPDGHLYVFGSNSFYGVDFTENTAYYLPNFYTYPEASGGFLGTAFGQAELDVAEVYDYPTIGRPKIKYFGNTYDRNYKIMERPRYASTWHLIRIESSLTQEEVSFEYEKREGLTYFSDKSYNHSFPNFGVQPDRLTTKLNTGLNPLQDGIQGRWVNGRAEFALNAVETKLDRWHLVQINTGRGERARFSYEQARGELAYDSLCTHIYIERETGADYKLFKGWELVYELPEGPEIVFDCGPVPDSLPTGPAIRATNETEFGTGEMYEMNWYDFHTYLNFTFRIGCFGIGTQLPIGWALRKHNWGYREKMSDFGSIMEIKAFPDPFDVEKFKYEAAVDSAVYVAENRRTFLRKINGIDREGQAYDLITDIAYYEPSGSEGLGSIPKRFSVMQDEYGFFNDNSASGSPLPPISYEALVGEQNVSSDTDGICAHFPFFNTKFFSAGRCGVNNTHKGQSKEADLAFVRAGALKQITYATGAEVAFEYELNEFPEGAKGAGLRVSTLTEAPGDTPAKITKYEYEEPAFNNLPVRVFHNKQDVYLVNSFNINGPLSVALDFYLESKVTSTSSAQNKLFPNGNGVIGYHKVVEKWDGNGAVEHYFSTPANYGQHLYFQGVDINATDAVNTHYYYRNNWALSDVLDIVNVLNPNGFQENPISQYLDFPPALSIPSPLHRSGIAFGKEYKTLVKDEAGSVVKEELTDYEVGEYKGRESTAGNIVKSHSAMVQYNHHGSFSERYYHRLVTQFLPFNFSAIDGLLGQLVDLMLNISKPHPFKYVSRHYYTVQYGLEDYYIRLRSTQENNYPSGGGENSIYTTFFYVGAPDEVTTLERINKSYSDNIQTSEVYRYSFGQNLNVPGFNYFDQSLISFLNGIDYHRPLFSRKTVRTGSSGTFYPVEQSFTVQQVVNGKVVPKAHYALQNGDIRLRGYFEDFDSDGLPKRYFQAKYGADLGGGANSFFDEIEVSWNERRQLLQKSYIGFTFTNHFNDFGEYTGSTDHNGVSSAYSYDDRGRLKNAIAYNNRQVTSFSYTIGPGQNRVTAKTSFGDSTPDQITIEETDGFGKLKQKVRASDGSILEAHTYDAYWRPVKSRAIGTGEVINEYEPSPSGQILKQTDAEDNVYEWSYSAGGSAYFWEVNTTDPNGHSVAERKNGLGLLLSSRQVDLNASTSYEYDNQLRLKRIFNPIGEVFEYEYNDMGLLKSKKVPGKNKDEFWYDEKYRLVASKDGKGQVILYRYDDYDRPKASYLYSSAPLNLGIDGFQPYPALQAHFQPSAIVR